MSGKMYMAVELGTTEADMVFEINKLRGKLQRADKKIKEKMGIIDELHDHLKGMMCENATLRNESSRAYYHKDLYETGAKIRRELAATIIEKDKSIGELVDAVTDRTAEREMWRDASYTYEQNCNIAKSDASALLDKLTKIKRENEANVDSLNYLSNHVQDYARQLLANDETIHGLKKDLRDAHEKNKSLDGTDERLRKTCIDYINGHQSKCIELREVSAQLGIAERLIVELRDKYEPNLVRCEGYAACQDHRCKHWAPHKEFKWCTDESKMCTMWNCIKWRGDA